MNESMNRFEFAAKVMLYLIAALLPLWFLPGLQNIDYGREITFGALAVLAFILWLLSVLTTGEVRFRHSLLLYGAALLFVIFGISTIFSKAPLYSALLADPVAEKLSTLFIGLLLFVIVGGVMRTKKDAQLLLLVLTFSGALAAITYSLQLLFNISLFRFITFVAQAREFNAVGTANAFALFDTALLLLGLGFMVAPSFRAFRAIIRYAFIASVAVLTFNLLLINFRTSWIVLLGSGIFFLGLLFKDSRRSLSFQEENTTVRAKRRKGIDWRSGLVMGFLALSVLMVMIRVPVIGGVVIPAEVSPNIRATMNIANRVFNESPRSMLFGSGPGTFGLDWGLYKDPSFNAPQNIGGAVVDLWNVRFNQGFSLVATYAVTAGVFGLFAFLAFWGVALIVSLRRMLIVPEEEMSYAVSAFLGVVAVFMSAFLYPANFTIQLFGFLVLGALTVFLARPKPAVSLDANFSEGEGETRAPRVKKNFWEVREERIQFEHPWAVFLSSLAAVFLLSLGVAGIYFQVGRARAAFEFQAASSALNQGKIEEAIQGFEQVTVEESSNYRGYHALTQARTEKIRQLIQRAAQGENVQQEFLGTITNAQQSAQRAIDLAGNEPLVWRTQGALYELIIPFVQGSEKYAFDSYKRATDFDPLNPAVWVELGRTALTYADRLQLMANQARGQEQQQILQARLFALQEAEKAFQKATEVKPDFAPAHFLSAQTALRLGNIQGAIKSTENARNTAPFDIGIAFQLGLLYYQTNDFDRAQAEFERAISMNQNYSNARYFLGLIYSRKGSALNAVQQFEEILKFNPDNQEVQKILVNLRAGKSALTGIVPPAEPPEKRRETPVKEGTRR